MWTLNSTCGGSPDRIRTQFHLELATVVTAFRAVSLCTGFSSSKTSQGKILYKATHQFHDRKPKHIGIGIEEKKGNFSNPKSDQEDSGLTGESSSAVT